METKTKTIVVKGQPVDLSITISDFYRENRHGSKIAKTTIKAIKKAESETTEGSWDIRVRITKEKLIEGDSVIWIFSDIFPEELKKEVNSCYDYESLEKVFSKMTKRRTCM